MDKVEIFGLKISTFGFLKTVNEIKRSVKEKKGLNVYCVGLNDAAAADEDFKFKKILNSGDILTPDGMPLVHGLRRKTGKGERVYGPELLAEILNSKFKIPKQMFVGNDKNKNYFLKYGDYLVAPFKTEFRPEDIEKMAAAVRDAKAQLVWIGLGAKKQVIVAERLRKAVPDRVYITVGAAFDFLSGQKPQAPRWLRNRGGEWLYRLATEPRRLLSRYLRIMRFLWRSANQKPSISAASEPRGKN